MFGKKVKMETSKPPSGFTGLILKGEVTILLKDAGKGWATIEVIGAREPLAPANLTVGDTMTVTVPL